MCTMHLDDEIMTMQDMMCAKHDDDVVEKYD